MFKAEYQWEKYTTMCKTDHRNKLNGELERPIQTPNLDQSLWNDKCDYVDIESCKNLNLNDYNPAVLQLNTHSILSKQGELNQLLWDLECRNSKVDVVMLCKTFLNKNTLNLLKIPGYTIFANSRSESKGGGTAILVREGIICQRLNNIVIQRERAWIHICGNQS